MGYPKLDPPRELRKIASTTLEEAQRVLEWFPGQIEPRSAAALNFLGIDEGLSGVNLLREAGARALPYLHGWDGNIIHSDGSMAFDGPAFDLACDVGILVARELQRAAPHLVWRILEPPKRRKVTNLHGMHEPCLTGAPGFPGLSYLPFTDGTQTSYRIRHGIQPPDEFARRYSYYRTLSCREELIPRCFDRSEWMLNRKAYARALVSLRHPRAGEVLLELAGEPAMSFEALFGLEELADARLADALEQKIEAITRVEPNSKRYARLVVKKLRALASR